MASMDSVGGLCASDVCAGLQATEKSEITTDLLVGGQSDHCLAVIGQAVIAKEG